MGNAFIVELAKVQVDEGKEEMKDNRVGNREEGVVEGKGQTGS